MKFGMQRGKNLAPLVGFCETPGLAVLLVWFSLSVRRFLNVRIFIFHPVLILTGVSAMADIGTEVDHFFCTALHEMIERLN